MGPQLSPAEIEDQLSHCEEIKQRMHGKRRIDRLGLPAGYAEDYTQGKDSIEFVSTILHM
jgi:hypothetical protein